MTTFTKLNKVNKICFLGHSERSRKAHDLKLVSFFLIFEVNAVRKVPRKMYLLEIMYFMYDIYISYHAYEIKVASCEHYL